MQSGLSESLILAGIWQGIAHNWALISILTTVGLLIIIPTLVVHKYVRIVLNILRDTEPPLFMSQHGFETMIGDDIELYAPDGVCLQATLHRTTAAKPHGMIVFSPEFKSPRQSASRYCRPLLAAGFDVFTFDFRGQGQSAKEENYVPRQWASDREVTDLSTALAYCEHWLTEQGRSLNIGLFGISRGAGACLLAAEDFPSVKCIVTDGAFSSDSTLEHFMKRWAGIFAKVRIVYENHPPEFWRFLRWCLFLRCKYVFGCTYPSARKALMRMTPRPILFIHGQRDSYIPVAQSELLYALAAQPKYRWVVPKAKHNQSVDIRPEEYTRRTVAFFQRYLADLRDPDNIYEPAEFADILRPGPARWRDRGTHRPADAAAELQSADAN